MPANLVPQGLRIGAGQSGSAAAAGRRYAGNDLMSFDFQPGSENTFFTEVYAVQLPDLKVKLVFYSGFVTSWRQMLYADFLWST